MDIKREIEVDIPDHEVLISFNDDWQGYAFSDWWRDTGKNAFKEFLKAEGDKYV